MLQILFCEIPQARPGSVISTFDLKLQLEVERDRSGTRAAQRDRENATWMEP